MTTPDAGVHPVAHVPLAPLTTLGVGGAARWFVRARSIAEVVASHVWASHQQVPLVVLGGGSNVVVADRGVDALVVHMGVTGVSFDPQGSVTRVWAGAGESWDGLVQQVVERGLAGLECLSGIPGSVGGTPVQNVGAYGQEVARVIAEVQVYDRVEQREATIPVEACGFGYRTSRFKGGDRDRFVVCGVTFEVRPGNGTATYPDLVAELAADAASATVARVRDAVLAVRRRKGMVLDPQDGDTRSVGSFFTNPVVMSAEVERIEAAQAGQVPSYATETGRRKLSAAWLIEQAGMTRGTTRGAVGLSGKHTLAIVNRGGATASDVVRFAGEIKRRVLDRFGIWLTPEPVFVGFGDDPGVRWLEERGK